MSAAASARPMLGTGGGGRGGENDREMAMRDLARVLAGIEARWPDDLPSFVASSIAVLRKAGYMSPAMRPGPLTVIRGGKTDDAE